MSSLEARPALLRRLVLEKAPEEDHLAQVAAAELLALAEQAGLEPLKHQHEAGPGQHEIVLRHAATTYTARPSLPPDDSRAGLYQTPEAEIALEQLGISQLPNMGLGPMQWLADQFGGKIWDYAKPAATQSIAALLAATGTPLTKAATTAYQFTHLGRANELVCGLDGAVACVFEDNAGGVRGCQKAAAALAERGIHVTVRGFGIATDPAKRAALAQVCEGVYDDVNIALITL